MVFNLKFTLENISPAPSGGPPWDLTSEKIGTLFNDKRQLIVSSRLNCAPNYTRLFVSLKCTFQSQKSHSLM